MYSLKEIAQKINGKVFGSSNVDIKRIATLKNAIEGDISFFTNKKYLSDLKNTRASAVIINEAFINYCSTNAIIVDNAYFSFVKVSRLLNDFDKRPMKFSIDRSAIISDSASIDDNVSIGANVVIEDKVIISSGVRIGHNTVILKNSFINNDTEIGPNVSIYDNVKVGKRCKIHSNSVIGSDGFGNVKDKDGSWVKIPQLGGVLIGDDVEIGSCTSIDRGTIDNTIISNSVKLDNQIQIAHNVIIGENTAIAGSTGIAGSTEIGKNCLIGGQVGISGHVKICDNVILAAASNVSKDIKKPGFYTAAFNARPHMEWKRTSARIFRLEKLVTRVSDLEKNTEK